MHFDKVVRAWQSLPRSVDLIGPEAPFPGHCGVCPLPTATFTANQHFLFPCPSSLLAQVPAHQSPRAGARAGVPRAPPGPPPPRTHSQTISTCSLSLTHTPCPVPMVPAPGHLGCGAASRVQVEWSYFHIHSSPALNKPHPCKPLPSYGPVATPLGGSWSRSWDSAHLWDG